MTALALGRRQYLDLEKLALGAFSPVTGFMDRREWKSVVETMRLPDGELFPLPIALDVDSALARQVEGTARVTLTYRGARVAEVAVSDVFRRDLRADAREIFGTDRPDHAGVKAFLGLPGFFIGGRVVDFERAPAEDGLAELTPAESRRVFAENGWETVAGFQTRNPPHRAHEYLQRVALEHVDGLLVQPLVGRKKPGDFAPDAVLRGYRALLDHVYPKDRVLLSPITVSMWYAGPREAVFHAVIRRNYGCTHFIVGRDHAGVGDWYGKYAAHELTRRFDGELGIRIMRLHGPYHCEVCDGIVTERTCRHGGTAATTEISGTWMRRMLQSETIPPTHVMRREVVAAVRGAGQLFIEEESA
ncbi:sulfate adenylyltransferase [Microbispora bryophytorum]|uniref:sulfate adenylyltransferase n=1 Tax=Microbispora bryophytorum TaxID=1460882 RepID=UPI0033E30E27